MSDPLDEMLAFLREAQDALLEVPAAFVSTPEGVVTCRTAEELDAALARSAGPPDATVPPATAPGGRGPA